MPADGSEEKRKLKPRVLVVDVGGSNVKLKVSDQEEVKFASGKGLRPASMVAQIKKATAGWQYDVVSIGYPGVVKNDRVLREPVNLGKGWAGFDFAQAFAKPVKMVNDAAMQALGSTTRPGLTLFMGVGTGLGVALVLAEKNKEGQLVKRAIPTELGHARYSKKKDYEALVSRATLEGKDGKVSKKELKKWSRSLQTVVSEMTRLFSPDQIVIGGGNVKRLDDFRAVFPDEKVVAGDNDFAFAGGESLWQ